MMWFAALALVLPFISPAHTHDHQAKRHHANVNRHSDLVLRDLAPCTNARFTFFADGLGACGQTSQPSDFIVALNSAQFNKALCFESIAITINGQTENAVIVDECPGCPPCGLDFSSGLFQAFDPLGVGVIYGDWSLGSGAPAPSSSAPPPPPPTSSVETPTTSYPPSTTSQPPPTTTSTTTSFTAGSSNSSMVPTQTSTNAIAEPSGVLPGGTASSSVLFELNSYPVLFAGLLESCSSLQ